MEHILGSQKQVNNAIESTYEVMTLILKFAKYTVINTRLMVNSAFYSYFLAISFKNFRNVFITRFLEKNFVLFV